MKIERLPEYLTIIVTITCGMLLSMYLGVSTGGGSGKGWLIMIGIVALVIALIMRANIWLLIPIAWPLMGQITGMPGSFPVRDVVIIYVFPVFLALKALKVVRSKTHYNWLDYVLFLNLAYLATVFIRNPVGTESMGLDRVGGKTYFDAVFAFLGYWVIGHVTLSPKLARWMPFLMIIGYLFRCRQFCHISLSGHKRGFGTGVFWVCGSGNQCRRSRRCDRTRGLFWKLWHRHTKILIFPLLAAFDAQPA